jgi:hypothetical protein
VKVNQLLVPITLIGLSLGLLAQTESPVQSAARPYKLDIVDEVQVAGSDEASKIFQAEVLPGMLKLVNTNLNEYQKLSNKLISALAVDPSKLALTNDTAARVYFLGEGAGNRNTLGFSTMDDGPLSKDAELIFPDASSSAGFNGSGKAYRSKTEPLLPGDFVDLGKFEKGTILDFFLIANGAVGGKDFFSTNQSLNKDGLVHAVSLAPEGSPYLIISFEDISGGGDRDYNDLVFAVYLGKENIANLAALGAPEPSLAAGALLTLGAVFGRKRRR